MRASVLSLSMDLSSHSAVCNFSYTYFGSTGQQFECIFFVWYRLICMLMCVRECVCVRACGAVVYFCFYRHLCLSLWMMTKCISTILYAAPLNNFIVWNECLLLYYGHADIFLHNNSSNSRFPPQIGKPNVQQQSNNSQTFLLALPC